VSTSVHPSATKGLKVQALFAMGSDANNNKKIICNEGQVPDCLSMLLSVVHSLAAANHHDDDDIEIGTIPNT
jgi:hypothetical protein